MLSGTHLSSIVRTGPTVLSATPASCQKLLILQEHTRVGFSPLFLRECHNAPWHLLDYIRNSKNSLKYSLPVTYVLTKMFYNLQESSIDYQVLPTLAKNLGSFLLLWKHSAKNMASKAKYLSSLRFWLNGCKNLVQVSVTSNNSHTQQMGLWTCLNYYVVHFFLLSYWLYLHQYYRSLSILSL